MRDLTQEEMEEYLRFARSDTGAKDFHQEQAEMIGGVITGTVAGRRLISAVATKASMAQAAGYEARDVFLSLWVSAFQMGRECENRLLTQALKGKVVAP